MESDPDMEEATPKEKLAIAKHFIMQSPNGEVDDVVKDMKKLVGGNLITEEWENTVYAKYNKAQFVSIGKGDDMVICSKYSETSDGKFLNPNSKQSVAVNHKSGSVTDKSGAQVDDLVEEMRAATQKAVDSYLEKNYIDGKATCCVYGSQGKLDIVISAKNLNIANFWSGGWRSEYSVEVSNAGKAEMSGRVRINVHYFEDGNVQLNTDFSPDGISVNVGDPASTAKEIAEAISKAETQFHEKLEMFYVNMHSETFKGMRRILPKKGTKMEWRAAVHKIANEMGENKA